jgi:hypothetical protein
MDDCDEGHHPQLQIDVPQWWYMEDEETKEGIVIVSNKMSFFVTLLFSLIFSCSLHL